MPLQLLLDCVQPVVEVLRFGMQPNEFGHQRRQRFFTQGCGAFLGDRCAQTLPAVERAITQDGLILGNQSTTASAGAIKLRRTLRTQTRATLRVQGGTVR